MRYGLYVIPDLPLSLVPLCSEQPLQWYMVALLPPMPLALKYKER